MEAFFRGLFEANRVILIASYGQAFFVLGLSVALQWRRESRLELARSVPLLAAFGLVEAFVIWGDQFIPSQADLLAPQELMLLRLLQLLFMLLGFSFLFHFGLRLNWSAPWTSRLPWLLATVAGVALALAYANAMPIDLLRLRFEQGARWLFVLPGSLLAAWGMRQSASQVAAMGLPRHIVGWMRVAGFSFGAYALFGGLLVPLTVEQLDVTRFAVLGIPLAVPRLLAVAVLAWAMIQALTIFRVELQRAMEEMGRLRALASDRQRIGRELHDGTIQAIYGAGLMLENAMTQMRDNPAAAEEMFRGAMGLLNQTIADIRRYIFALREGEGQLAEALGLLVSDVRQQSGCEIEYRLEGTIPRLPAEVQSHLIQIAREALTNAVRHAAATEIVLSLRGEADALVLTVADDGRGLPAGGAFRPGGQGVPNLRARAALMQGALRVVNRPGGGVLVELVLPYRAPEPVSALPLPNGQQERLGS